MGISSSIITPQELNEFRKLNTGTIDDFEIPVSSRNRKLTDKKGFIIFAIVLAVFVPFLIYTLVKSDIRRLNHDSDSCGNLCGINNSKIEGITCSGKDYTRRPYKKYYPVNNTRTCTDECPPGYQDSNGRCYDPDDVDGEFSNYTVTIDDHWQYTRKSAWKFSIVIIITIILCLLTLLLFRYQAEIIVWGILIISILLTIIVTCLSWYWYTQLGKDEGARYGVLVLAITLTIFSILAITIFVILFKKIRLIILLYKETAKAIFSMPFLTLLPILTIFLQLIIATLVIITTTWMVSAANLVEVEKGKYDYIRNGAMIFTMTFNVAMGIWAMQFFAGCQYMITAGSVASWYFARNNRLYLDSPIWTSIANTVKYHLGTVALGSFILTLIAIIKALIKSLIRSDKVRWLVDCCFSNVEAFLKFLSKNAYIETAIHGQSFFRSGKRAAQLLIHNASSVIAINSVGDFVLAMTQLLLLIICTAIAYGLFSNVDYGWVPTLISFIISLGIVVIIFAVFETTVDALFICFCEDQLLNDGQSKPYCMSTNLMQFIEDSKKVYKDKK